MPFNDRYIERIYTVQPGNPASAPVTQTDYLGDVIVNEVNVRIPPGHAGQTGFQVVYGGSVVLPWNDASAFLIDDDKDYDFVIGFEFDQGLAINLYNVGSYPHSFYVRWDTTPVSLVAPNAVGGIGPIVQLAGQVTGP